MEVQNLCKVDSLCQCHIRRMCTTKGAQVYVITAVKIRSVSRFRRPKPLDLNLLQRSRLVSTILFGTRLTTRLSRSHSGTFGPAALVMKCDTVDVIAVNLSQEERRALTVEAPLTLGF